MVYDRDVNVLRDLVIRDANAARQVCDLIHDYDDAGKLAALVAENSLVVQSGDKECADLIRRFADYLMRLKYHR